MNLKPTAGTKPKARTALFVLVLLIAAVGVGIGNAAAHNPAGNQPGGSDGPHYGDDGVGETGDETASSEAYDHNPNLKHACRPGSEHPDHANSKHNRDC